MALSTAGGSRAAQKTCRHGRLCARGASGVGVPKVPSGEEGDKLGRVSVEIFGLWELGALLTGQKNGRNKEGEIGVECYDPGKEDSKSA